VLFNFVLEYAIRRVQENHEGLKVNGTLQLLIYVGDVSIVSGNTHTAKKNTKSLIATSEQIGVAVYEEEAKLYGHFLRPGSGTKSQHNDCS
jgi:hypothetical protein